jgi:hypothetical protein
MKYAPKVYVETDPVGHVQACDKHVEDLLTNYSDPHGKSVLISATSVSNVAFGRRGISFIYQSD